MRSQVPTGRIEKAGRERKGKKRVWPVMGWSEGGMDERAWPRGIGPRKKGADRDPELPPNSRPGPAECRAEAWLLGGLGWGGVAGRSLSWGCPSSPTFL